MGNRFKYRKLSRESATVLFIDHQTGLLSLVQDFSPSEFTNNILALAAIAKYFGLPTLITTSFEKGPNGPIMPELKEMLPNVPYFARPGQINAWDNKDFVKAIKHIKRNQLIIAGIVTDVCVAFPTLSALEEGYEVFVVTDASGTFNKAARYAAWTRMASSGAQLMNWFSIASELQRDWRVDIEGFGSLLAKYLPPYKNLMASFQIQEKKSAA